MSTLLKAVHSPCTSTRSITLKFFEPGHTAMSADAIHQVISKNLKRKGVVEDFQDYLDSTADAGVRCTVMEPGKNMVEAEDAISRHSLKVLAEQGLRPYIAEFKTVKVQRGSDELFTKTALHRATLAARMLGTAASLPEGEPLRALAEATPTRRLKTTTGWRDRGREALAQLDRHINFEEPLRITVPPWCAPEGVTFSLEVGPDGRRDRPPDIRRRAAEDRLAELPSEATWIWSDGSASGGVMDGGGGAIISFPSGDTREVRVAAGSL